MKKLSFGVLVVAIAYVVVGTLLDSVLLPEAEPGPAFYPSPGYQFYSQSEGFRQTVLRRENGLFWVALELEPHAAGPPEHIHTSFAEKFAVAEGTLSVLFQGQRRTLRAGETLLVPPGTAHKPFNETGSRVIVTEGAAVNVAVRPEVRLVARQHSNSSPEGVVFHYSPDGAALRVPNALREVQAREVIQ